MIEVSGKMNLLKTILTSAIIFFSLLASGCSMPKPGVLTFDEHTFNLKCYRASDMKVAYGNYHSLGLSNRAYTPNHERRICRAKKLSDNDSRGSMIGLYSAFEGPLHVQWHALDDSVINATVDLDEIFPDKEIPNNEDPKQIDWNFPTSGLPAIVIEVNDRTLNIYSDVTILLEAPDHNPSHRISKRNRKLVFSKTYTLERK